MGLLLLCTWRVTAVTTYEMWVSCLLIPYNQRKVWDMVVFLEHSRHVLNSGPLHLLLTLPKILFPQTASQFAPSPPSGLCSNSTPSERPPITTLFTIATPRFPQDHPPIPLTCLIFLHTVNILLLSFVCCLYSTS